MRMLGKSNISTFVATKDANRARKFYENILGLTFVSDDPYALVFDANGTTLRIQKVQDVSPVPYTTLGWHVTGIEGVVAELKANGVTFEFYDVIPQDELGIATFPGGARVAWFKDPDGNLLSLDEY
jgi:catechol 2,3-dioxygenase-like lactoylglutathione lyase family enzyme